MDSVFGLAVYAVSILVAACILHVCVERPFLKLRDRVLDKQLRRNQTLSAVPEPVTY
jgi:peptidoglycan/LPS O-acetylase OafA/YrhL